MISKILSKSIQFNSYILKTIAHSIQWSRKLFSIQFMYLEKNCPLDSVSSRNLSNSIQFIDSKSTRFINWIELNWVAQFWSICTMTCISLGSIKNKYFFSRVCPAVWVWSIRYRISFSIECYQNHPPNILRRRKKLHRHKQMTSLTSNIVFFQTKKVCPVNRLSYIRWRIKCDIDCYYLY